MRFQLAKMRLTAHFVNSIRSISIVAGEVLRKET